MSLLPDPDDSDDTERATELLRFQAELLHRRAVWLEASGMIALGAAFGALAYLFADVRGGWNHKPSWEPLAGLAFGAALGLGVARPFAEWLRLQARLVHLQVLVERHTRRTQEHSEATARKLEGLVETGLSGEWRTSGADIPAVP